MLKADIFSKADCRLAKVHIPEWEGDVWVKTLTHGERRRAKADLTGPDAGLLLVVLATCDENGNRLFEESDLDQLANRNATALDRIMVAAAELNTPDEVALKKS